MESKTNGLKGFLVDVEKQDWEIREHMEHNTGVSRTSTLKSLGEIAEELSYRTDENGVTDSMAMLPLYYGWLEALAWMKENIKSELGDI